VDGERVIDMFEKRPATELLKEQKIPAKQLKQTYETSKRDLLNKQKRHLLTR